MLLIWKKLLLSSDQTSKLHNASAGVPREILRNFIQIYTDWLVLPLSVPDICIALSKYDSDTWRSGMNL